MVHLFLGISLSIHLPLITTKTYRLRNVTDKLLDYVVITDTECKLININHVHTWAFISVELVTVSSQHNLFKNS